MDWGRVLLTGGGHGQPGPPPETRGGFLMLDQDSLAGVAFRYARWLRETEQWDAMDLFSFVIHPAIGRLAGMGRTQVADLTPAIVRRALLIAAQDRIEPSHALGAWEDFLAYLAAEGIHHRPDLLDQAS